MVWANTCEGKENRGESRGVQYLDMHMHTYMHKHMEMYVGIDGDGVMLYAC